MSRNLKKRKLNATFTISRPHLPQSGPSASVNATTFRRTNGRLSGTNVIITPDDPLDDETAHLNPWQTGFCEELRDVDDEHPEGLDDVVSAEQRPRDPVKTPITEWKPYRQEYLEELLRHDGRASQTSCAACGAADAHLKCHDCCGCRLLCLACLLNAHTLLPLHRVVRWTGTHFQTVSLKALGLVVQLGHNGDTCPCRGTFIPNFAVVDTSGIHQINLQFCGCYSDVENARQRTQLLRFRWMPATPSKPQTAFTFDVLQAFHLLTAQSKISAYDYYLSIVHRTDNTGRININNRYEQFLLVIRAWRHLKLLKRSGRGHDPAGVEATKPGECAVECPACPHPGRNLPFDRSQTPPHRLWLSALILTIDANFRLKNKERNLSHDVSLGDGWAHWVESGPYQRYISTYGNQEEPNLCESELHAVDHANKKFSKGYRSTGAGGVLCARHSLVCKNGLGDLQKGERYANMDFIVFSTLVGAVFTSLILSYDIMCQWSRNLATRIPQLPSYMQISTRTIESMKKVIPKLHIYGHGRSCQTKYSLNYLEHSARTNGEEPECWWAHINPVSMSTREMGPGACHDTIDDHAAAWNWRKITGFGTHLFTQLRTAIRMRAKHKALHNKLTARFPPDVIGKWEAIVIAWEADPCLKNPYEEPDIGTTLKAVQAELAREELEGAQCGGTLHEVSPNKFLSMGLELEEQQRVLAHRIAKAKKAKNTESADLYDKRATLFRRIENWRGIQEFYMPGVSELRMQALMDGSPPAESVALHLPSSISPALRENVAILAQKEQRLRLAQADDALLELRRLLRITMGLWHYKFTQVGPSQRSGTRARSLIDRFKEKVFRCAERYRAARAALLSLNPTGVWITRLHELKAEDVRAPGRQDDETEGDRHVSWIWLTSQSDRRSADDAEVNNSLRIEWMKSRARMKRWSEEILLVEEEMRRVLCFLMWRAQWWVSKGNSCQKPSPELCEGLAAYSAKQAEVLQTMAISFAREWKPLLESHGMSPSGWPDEVSKHLQIDSHASEVVAEVEDDGDDDDDIFL